MDLILKALVVFKSSTPSFQYREKQLQDLLSLILKQTMQECDARFDDTINNHMILFDQKLNINTNTVNATNEFINHSPIIHEK